MLRVFFMITAFINIILLFNFVGSKVTITGLRANEIKLFQRFKDFYNRVYPDEESEQKGFYNFLNSLDELNRLNKEHPGPVIAYQLNRYADQNPEEINEHFAIQIKPYDNMLNGNKEAVQREHRHQFIEDMHLYDLYKVDDLYKEWMKKWGKSNFTKKIKKTAQYYRFVKTVVETNNKKFAGEDVSLGRDADVVREPNQYFYG